MKIGIFLIVAVTATCENGVRLELPAFLGHKSWHLSSWLEVIAMSVDKAPSKARKAYKFIEAHRDEFSIQVMCRLLGVARAGYYAWLDHPVSDRAQEDARLLRLIRASFTASHGIYGAPRVLQDLRERGETCSKHRVARLMRENGLRALHGYRTRHIPVARSQASTKSW